MGLLSMLRIDDRAPAARRRRAFSPSLHPNTESLESRLVMSAAQVAAPVAAAVVPNIVITNVTLTGFEIVNNVLKASGEVTGTLAGLPFSADITNFALRLIPDDLDTDAVECAILNLELAPINLALLGLHVDTSAICLEITATEGGGPLGELLCGLAGGDLGIPTLPTLEQVDELTAGVSDLLSGALNFQQATPSQGGAESVCTGDCHILELAVGPLDISLLGLNVSLDDCEDGPVQICVSATRSEGLLGSLLCGLAGGQGINLDFGDITQLGTRATELVADGTLSNRDVGTLTVLLSRLIR